MCVCVCVWREVPIYPTVLVFPSPQENNINSRGRGKGKVHPRTYHEGPEGEKYSSTLSLTSAQDGVGGQRHAPGRFTPGTDPVPFLQEAGWAPGPIWTGAENLAPTGIRSPDCPAHSKSLYRLRSPGPSETTVPFHLYLRVTMVF